MRRNKDDQTTRPSFADLTWKSIDLALMPLRESTAFVRRWLEVGADRGSDEESTDSRMRETSSNIDDEPAEVEDEPTNREDDGPSDGESGASLEDVWGVGPARAPKLREHGLSSLKDVAEADVATLTTLAGVGAESAERIKQSAEDLLDRD
ncbi:MAG: helix-hairpin-helix domain-containing protein [Bradymonadaceae bacterium]